MDGQRRTPDSEDLWRSNVPAGQTNGGFVLDPNAAATAKQLAEAIEKPLSTSVKMLIQSLERNSEELEAARKNKERARVSREQVLSSHGFDIINIQYRPGISGIPVPEYRNGVAEFKLLGETVSRSPIKAFCMLAVMRGDMGQNTNIGTAATRQLIYGSVGPRLATSSWNLPPNNPQFILQASSSSTVIVRSFRLHTTGIDSITLWSGTSFDAIIYVTAGGKEELPEFM